MSASSKGKGSSKPGTVAGTPQDNNLKFMSDVTAYFADDRIGKKRIAILSKQLEKYGGKIGFKLTEDTTHIVVDKGTKIERLYKILGVEKISKSISVVTADWLSACYMECRKCDVSRLYTIDRKADESSSDQQMAAEKLLVESLSGEKSKEGMPVSSTQPVISSNLKGAVSNTNEHVSPSKSDWWTKQKGKRKHSDSEESDSSYIDSGDDAENYQKASPVKADKLEALSLDKIKGNWTCTKPSTSQGENLNAHITEKLEVLARAYENTQDRWRALSYKKAISAIKNHPTRIETAKQVEQLSFVGDRLGKKVIEILETGHLRRLDHMGANMGIINLFADVWGAGPKTAEAWVAQGFKTLDDLREKADLNFQQQIGLKFYDEFLERMPRSEVEEIENSVRETACSLTPGMEITTCGSYRRGRETCGDIDLLVSHPDGRSHKGFLTKLVNALQKKGLITDDLFTVNNQEQHKYMGVCQLPGEDRKHRRIDIIVAPYAEWACALVHFTGSGRLNRSMRQLAKIKGMSLSEHGLREGVVRSGQEKIHKGNIVLTFSEQDIFRHLGLDYLEPHERDW